MVGCGTIGNEISFLSDLAAGYNEGFVLTLL